MKKIIFTFLSFLPGFVFAASKGHLAPHLEGGDLSVIWAIPFAGILLSIAILPLVASKFWHHNFGKVSAFWAILLLLPMIVKVGFSVTVYELLHVFLLEYL